jgi:hypothetical protein
LDPKGAREDPPRIRPGTTPGGRREKKRRLKEIIPHTSDTKDLLVKLTAIRWRRHARERIDIHEAYYWMDKQEETMWAKDKQDLLPATSTK